MIFRRALQREFGHLAVAVFTTLFAITLTTQLIRLLGQAANGKVLSEAVFALLAFSSLNYMPVLLSLTLFVSVLMAVSRSYRESEMVIWFSSGLSLLDWIRPVLNFGLPIVAVVALFSFYVSPVAVDQIDDYRRQMDRRDDLARVAPGVFREAASADRIFFVEGSIDDESTEVRNVFIVQNEGNKLNILVSQRGYRDTRSNGDRFVVLLNGRRYEGVPGQADYRVMDFDKYWLRVENKETNQQARGVKATSTWDLIQDGSKSAQAELLWRIGLPLSALLLGLLAVPLAFVNPRASRSFSLVFALLTYMVYSNLVSVAQAWVAQGKVSFAIGWWLIHAVMLLLLAFLFWRRMRVGSALRRS